MIEQIYFSEIIKEFLAENFPEFLSSLDFKGDGSFDCDLRNQADTFSIWLATYNSEITIGLEDPDGKTDIHTHLSCDDMEDLPETLDRLAKMINEIREDKLVLYKDESGYHWTDEPMVWKHLKLGDRYTIFQRCNLCFSFK
ncbi:hypothetical protein FAZ15_19870 [Sphingobacterium olei]|uniref:Uncharacterized protein n=1 Tax=Sphingobacterium olei TaxID=2571155 RepID=A0A4U0NCR4_9SPHI|nr:hypothetical protein [Sphingobacterium olei]TJZ51807.1 hypothetical protein FAZ15_19870 [Sphingobacterium olei]